MRGRKARRDATGSAGAAGIERGHLALPRRGPGAVIGRRVLTAVPSSDAARPARLRRVGVLLLISEDHLAVAGGLGTDGATAACRGAPGSGLVQRLTYGAEAEAADTEPPGEVGYPGAGRGARGAWEPALLLRGAARAEIYVLLITCRGATRSAAPLGKAVGGVVAN